MTSNSKTGLPLQGDYTYTPRRNRATPTVRRAAQLLQLVFPVLWVCQLWWQYYWPVQTFLHEAFPAVYYSLYSLNNPMLVDVSLSYSHEHEYVEHEREHD